MAMFPEGDYVIGGRSSSDQFMWMSRFSSGDTHLWSASYGGAQAGRFAEVTALAPMARRRVAVAGFEGMGLAKDAVIMTIDDVGMPLWFKSLRGADEDHFEGITPLSDGLAAYGFTTSVSPQQPIPASDFWIARTSVDGMLHFSADTDFSCANDAVTWQRHPDIATAALAPFNLDASLTSISAVNLEPVTAAGAAD
jgi:hypothetical protein